MKIGLVVPGFSDGEQDWCIPALLNMVRLLAAEHNVHVFTLRYPPRRATYTVYNATVHALGGGAKSGLHRLPLLRRALRTIRAHAPFDVLHGLWADEPGLVATLAGGQRSLVSLMGGELVGLREIGYGHQLSFTARQMIRASLRRADHITVGSSSLGQRLDRPNVSVVPLGVDADLFSPGDSHLFGAGFHLLHVASLVPVKNQALLLRACAELPDDTHLHIVGDGPLQPQLADLARALGVRVTFHGPVAHHHLPAYYRAADVCLLTSHYESQGMVVLEAAACGTPTLGTPVGILPDLLPEAWLADDVAGLAARLRMLYDNRSARDTLAASMREAVLQSMTLEHTAAAWLSLYQGKS